MIETVPSTVDRIVTDLRDVATDMPNPEIRRRTRNLLTKEGVSRAQVRAVVATQLAANEVASIETVKTARMEPLETTVVGIIRGITDRPETGAMAVWLVDGTGRLQVVLPADAIGTDSLGTAVRVRRAGVRRTLSERYAYARSRTSIEKVPT